MDMADNAKKSLQPFSVKCGDGTGGRVSATSSEEAAEMAQEMCRVHNGAQGEPQPQT